MWKKTQKTKEPENSDKAYEYAVFLLSLKLRTGGEIVAKMSQRGYTDAVISQTLERLKAQHYINDQQYAEIYLENLKAYRLYGYYGIKKKCMEKKIPETIIESMLQEHFSVSDELVIARKILKKEGYEVKKPEQDSVTYQSFGDDEQNKDKLKLANKLRSRGFRSEVIARVFSE